VRALCWHGKGDIRCDSVPDPGIEHPRDAIVKVTSCAICGSDLHLHDGYIPTMERGDILGHEFMGEVVEVGSENTKLKVGDRVVVPFTICCGECEQCRRGNWSVCQRTNRNARMAAQVYGHATAGLFGYSHLTGGYAGGQAEYVRVPYADVAPTKVPDGIPDERLLFLTDIFPTGWQAAAYCEIEPSDWVAIWGCGPVGQFAIRSAFLMGAENVVAIDRVPERLDMARSAGAQVINFAAEDVQERLQQVTGGKGPNKCIEAVGMETHASGSFDAVMDKVKAAVMLATDRIHALRQSMVACRPAGILSIAGVYGGMLDKVPFGAAFQKGLTIRMGQCNVPRYLPDLLQRIEREEIDPSFVITHRLGLEDGPGAYQTFRDKQDGCIKVMMRP
jgi:threonine dehydrogenase-like Zn-dependent dehydrogenase